MPEKRSRPSAKSKLEGSDGGGMRRISLMVREEQYNSLNSEGINLSGLVRDLIDDYLSDFKITLSVSEETRQIYDSIISNTGSTDIDVEKYLRVALKKMLEDKIESMRELSEQVFAKLEEEDAD